MPGTPITASTWSRTPPAETRPLLRKLAARSHTSPRWKQCPSSSRLAPVTWAETMFSLTQADVNGTLVLDIGSSNANMRGHYYLNGVDLARVWGIAQGGAPVQQYYYLPVDVVRSHQNRLTIVRQPTPAAVCCRVRAGADVPRRCWSRAGRLRTCRSCAFRCPPRSTPRSAPQNQG